MSLLSGTHVVCVNVGCCKSLDLIWNYTQDRQFFAIFFVVTQKRLFRSLSELKCCLRVRAHFSLALTRFRSTTGLCMWGGWKFSALNTFPMLMENRKYAYKRMDVFMWMYIVHTRKYAKSSVLKMHFMPSLTWVTREKIQIQYTTLCIQKIRAQIHTSAGALCCLHSSNSNYTTRKQLNICCRQRDTKRFFSILKNIFMALTFLSSWHGRERNRTSRTWISLYAIEKWYKS